MLDSAELYDVESDLWAPAATMLTAREYHKATVLNDGNVLVTGGDDINFSYLDTTELYNATVDTWVSAGTMSSVRKHHTISLLQSGKVLVIGGFDGWTQLSSADLYDPEMDNWAATSPHV